MRNTLDALHKKEEMETPNPIKLIGRALVQKMSIILIILCFNIRMLDAKQTVLAESLESKNDKILMRLLEETHNYIEFERYIQSRQFECKTILKNELTKNIPENYTQISLELDYGHVMSIKGKEHPPGYTSVQLEEIKRLDKILDLLIGKCLYYTTSTFIYQYCHKEHVRQFDNEFTKAMNVKTEFEDISMGLYNPDFYFARNAKKGKKQLTPEERKVTVPTKSDFSNDYNFLTFEKINVKERGMDVQESEDGKLLFTNINIATSDNYLMTSPLFLQLVCEEIQKNNTAREIRNFGMLVHPYTIVYTSKQGKCDRYIHHKIIEEEVAYLSNQNDPIRAFGSYLYGNVQQICTANWAWQKQIGNHDFDNNLEQGSLLFIQLYSERTHQFEHHYTTVKKIYNAQLIQLQIPLGKSFRKLPSFSRFLNTSTIQSHRLIGNITKCELLFKKAINLQDKFNIDYIGNGLIKINSSSQRKIGENIGCVCKSQVQNSVRIIDFDLTLSKHLWLNYYETFIRSNTFIFQFDQYQGKEYLLLECLEYTCFSFLEKQNQTKSAGSQKRFTQVVKLARNTKELTFNSTNMLHLYVLNIKNNGIIRLTTRSVDGTVYTYLISEGQIIKMIQFANGTKEIIKENKFYQNSTQPHQELHSNYIYIKISLLPNGSYYGGIWKVSDYIFFPRFLLLNEQLVSLERASGYAYVRILNLQNMKNKESLAIVKYMHKLQEHFTMKEGLSANPNANLFLDKSYSIGYSYVSGKYCDLPVNKYRKTAVVLTCGKPWFQITKLLETAPCEYWIKIETTLLCREGYKQVVEQDDQLLNRGENDSVLNNGILCHPLKGAYDEAYPYFYLRKELQ